MNNRDELFWSKVKEGGPDECWPWLAAIDRDGYGRFWIGYTFVPAHRYAFAYKYGEALNQKDIICHHCDNPKCCNPGHLFKGTTHDNVIDKMRKGRHSYKAHPRFTQKEVDIIKVMSCRGISSNKIAKEFGCAQSVIYRLLHNPTYTPKES